MNLWKTIRALAAGSPSIRLASCIAAVALLQSNAAAQENVIGPPDILQYPVEASPEAKGALETALLRDQIERGADLAICETLMREAKQWPPAEARDFSESDCRPEFKSKVAGNEGVFHWESDDARPTRCGSDCIGRPHLTRTNNVGRPNVRRASLQGYLHFVVEPPGDFVPNNRRVTFPFDVFFECAIERGARTGTFRVDVDFGYPIIGDPGILETLTNIVVAPLNVSARTESGIRRELSQLPTRTVTTAACSSIGVARPANAVEDRATFDFPAPRRQVVRPPVAALRDEATIEFLRITRKPLPPLIDPGIAQPGSPAAGQFTVFLNGLERFLPPQGLALPPGGGSAAMNYCTTIDMTDADRLQIIFTSDLGGAVWSQFGAGQNYGSGQPRTMMTGRTVVVPGTPKFNPVTGRMEPAKPEARLLQEFELLYRITYTPRPNTAAQPPSPPSRGGRPGLQGVLPGDRPQAAVDPSKPPAEPCRRF